MTNTSSPAAPSVWGCYVGVGKMGRPGAERCMHRPTHIRYRAASRASSNLLDAQIDIDGLLKSSAIPILPDTLTLPMLDAQ